MKPRDIGIIQSVLEAIKEPIKEEYLASKK